MVKIKPASPISDILWHFPGGPKWNKSQNRQETRPKPAAEAYAAFCSILQSKELRIGGYHEVVRISIPERRIPKKRGTKGKEITVKKHAISINTAPVCCLADIPEQALAYHAQRYGQYAIGFHRESALRGGFNPVFYAVDDQPIISHFWDAYNTLENFTADEVIEAANTMAEDAGQAIAEMEEQDNGGDRDRIGDGGVSPDAPDSVFVEEAAGNLESYVADAYVSVGRAMAFIKTFDRDEFETIYAEREWRNISPFKFRSSDIAMLILPNDQHGVPGCSSFTSKALPKLGLGSRMKVKSWSDIPKGE